MSQIVEFYSGRKKDWRGRAIEEMGAYSDDQLEDIHNYIQLLFPLETPSQFVNAPLLDAETIKAFNESPDLRGPRAEREERPLAICGEAHEVPATVLWISPALNEAALFELVKEAD